MPTNVLFVIGNGFDLNMGLKTSYGDFYKEYCQNDTNDSDIVKRFKTQILNDNQQDWKDFELGLGEHSTDFNSAEDFLTCHNDFVKKFQIYLEQECSNIDYDNMDEMAKNKWFYHSIVLFWKYIKTVPTKKFDNKFINKKSSGLHIYFLQFNYTNVFYELLGICKKPRIMKLKTFIALWPHVHGKINYYMTIGVNDITQIKNNAIKDDIREFFVKKEYWRKLQTQDVNFPVSMITGINTIKKTHIFCLFGTSIGETDKHWWERIGKRLKSTKQTIIIIFDKCDGLADSTLPEDVRKNEQLRQARTDEIKNRFIELSNLKQEWLNNNPNRIIIELNSTMFDFKLPRKTTTKIQKLGKSV